MKGRIHEPYRDACADLVARLSRRSRLALSRSSRRTLVHARPSSWTATDIVVAREAEPGDEKLSVLETWKGRLAAGDTLVVPEMRRFAEARSRTVVPWALRKETKPPVVVSGKRMVLFLKRAPADDGTGSRPDTLGVRQPL